MNSMGIPKVTTGPATEPVTLSEAKNHLKMEYTTDDALITSLIKTARLYVESYASVALGSQTIEVYFKYDGCNPVNIPRYPFISVTSVQFKDCCDWSTLTPTDYTIEDNKFSSKMCGQFHLIYTAGYTTVPEGIKTVIFQMVAAMYENRGDKGAELSPLQQTILNPYVRRPWL